MNVMGTGRFAKFMPWDAPVRGRPIRTIHIGVQLQVRVDLQLDIHSFVAVCRVLRSARKNRKKCLWGWPEDENVLPYHKAKRGLL